ncbi:hypothetical protein E2C11_23220 [Streptomyces lavendulae]|nr:hypothetical protein [Streptomyces lavendulae]TXJ75426.1 hypothetical protein E2C11_23220 [Streptomyces lavendulae]
MARLQILELPSGINDDRPPFLLVIDQVPTDEAKFDAIRRDLLGDGDLAPRLGARAVMCFEETIGIPANEVPVGPDGGGNVPYHRLMGLLDYALTRCRAAVASDDGDAS